MTTTGSTLDAAAPQEQTPTLLPEVAMDSDAIKPDASTPDGSPEFGMRKTVIGTTVAAVGGAIKSVADKFKPNVRQPANDRLRPKETTSVGRNPGGVDVATDGGSRSL